MCVLRLCTSKINDLMHYCYNTNKEKYVWTCMQNRFGIYTTATDYEAADDCPTGYCAV
jgi:hypothetical protein